MNRGPRPSHRRSSRSNNRSSINISFGGRSNVRISSGSRGYYRHRRGLFNIMIRSLFISSLINKAANLSALEQENLRNKSHKKGVFITIFGILLIVAAVALLFINPDLGIVSFGIIFVAILTIGFGGAYCQESNAIGNISNDNFNNNNQNINNANNVKCPYCGTNNSTNFNNCCNCGAQL